MSSAISSATARRRLLRRPASVWTSHISNRTFHSTSPRFSSDPVAITIETSLSVVHAYMQWQHATGLPWGIVIPLTALTLRLSLALPIALHARELQQKYLDIQPLKQAWLHATRKSVMRDYAIKGPDWCEYEVKRLMANRRKIINKKFGLSPWYGAVFLPLCQLPIFLVPIEVVRRMTGYTEGILGKIGGLFSSVSEQAKQQSEPAAQDMQNKGLGAAAAGQSSVVLQDSGLDTGKKLRDPAGQGEQEEAWLEDAADQSSAQAQRSGLDAAAEPASTTSHSAGLDTAASNSVASSQAFGLEPGFATEGILWFPNLLLPDPTAALPFMVSAAMGTNIYLTSRGMDGTRGASIWLVRLKRVMYMLVLAVPFIAIKVPAAVTMYWFSSACIAMVQNLVLNKWRPFRLPPTMPKTGTGKIAREALARAQLVERR